MAPPADRRPGFSRRAQYGLFLSYVLAIAGALVGAVLLVAQRYDPPAFKAMRSTVAEATTPVASGVTAAYGWVAGFPAAIGDYFHVYHENERLRAQVIASRRLLMRARGLNYENVRLRRLLRLRDAAGDVVVAARLVSSTASSTRRFGMLNAGFLQGVREGQPVEAPDGLVGRVVEVGPDSARVLLVLDPESSVPVRRTRDGYPASVVGRGDGLVDIRPANPALGALALGDVFVTSGTGGLYAPGTPVARVIGRAHDGSLGRMLADADTLDVAIVRHAFMPAPPPPRTTLP